jgi:hypothetical protein
MALKTDHMAELRQRIQALTTQAPPHPWKRVTSAAVGGLEAVGFADNSDLLLVISTSGRGVFECSTGERIARDREPPTHDCDWYDIVRLAAVGIGPLANTRIKIAGLYGGGLPTSTEDAWQLSVIAPIWPDHRVILSSPFQSLYTNLAANVQVFEDYDIRAYGFSETGRSFVIATSSDVTLFSRMT